MCERSLPEASKVRLNLSVLYNETFIQMSIKNQLPVQIRPRGHIISKGLSGKKPTYCDLKLIDSNW